MQGWALKQLPYYFYWRFLPVCWLAGCRKNSIPREMITGTWIQQAGKNTNCLWRIRCIFLKIYLFLTIRMDTTGSSILLVHTGTILKTHWLVNSWPVVIFSAGGIIISIVWSLIFSDFSGMLHFTGFFPMFLKNSIGRWSLAVSCCHLPFIFHQAFTKTL